MALVNPTLRKPPFYGRGTGFPWRINPATGGVQVTEGKADDATVGIEYVGDRYSVRGDWPGTQNHISEAIAHILLTRPGEHDTLPEFGSNLFALIFDPNHPETALEFETWVEVATERWEKRARIPVPEGVEWTPTGDGIDQGQLPVTLKTEFIRQQVPGNLVAPFVTDRAARAQEYPVGDVDAAGHDWTSRYYGQQIYQDGDVRFIRNRRFKRIKTASDDLFYEVGYGETWMLISYKVYGDIRFWWVIADYYVYDAAKRGEPRDTMDISGELEIGTLLRMPSQTKLLMELTA